LASQTARDDEKIFRFRNLWHVEYFGSRPKVTRHQKNLLLSPLHALCKRAFDLAVVFTAIPLIAPVMLVLAVLVKLSSPGPIFYSQSRTGKNGKPFRAFKFRSMVPNADDVLEQYLSANDDMRLEWERDHKLKRDPRVTNVGRFMRKTSLDELP
jgi:lipopolysaccharide/colanic/teichoic acid biosynthesis glycosyltransferase